MAKKRKTGSRRGRRWKRLMLRKHPTWRDFEEWLHATFVERRADGVYQIPALRGFLFQDPVVGMMHRRALWPKLQPHVQSPHGEDPAEIVANEVLLPMCLKSTPGSSRTRLDTFIRLWAPGGPLATNRAMWQSVPAFMDWWRARREERC